MKLTIAIITIIILIIRIVAHLLFVDLVSLEGTKRSLLCLIYTVDSSSRGCHPLFPLPPQLTVVS